MAERSKGTVLLVDDEAYVRDSLATLLERRGFAVRTAASADRALADGAAEGADAVVADLRMPGLSGLELLRELQARAPALPVVLLTGHGTVASAVECMRAGAFDYLLKPADPEELEVVLGRALAAADLEREVGYLRGGGSDGDGRRRPLGESEPWRRVVELVELAAPADTSVLLVGETGTGKEEVARLLHAESPRRDGPFVSVNCAAIPDELFESEFFGHRRGAFTGAVADRDGRFRVAHRGTLLLDEVDSLPERAQAKVLRVIEDGVFERVGESRPTRVDVRLICATNADLARRVEAGRFRADLWYRINVMTLEVPPLRERRDDVPILARAFLGELAGRLGKRVDGVDGEALALLTAYDWPGNVRELRNVVERGVLLERSSRLTVDSLPADLRRGAAAGGGAAGDVLEPGDLNLRRRLAAEEKRLLQRALREADGVKREAARRLGVDERNLAYYLRKHGLMEERTG
jgi:two-component system, NtrC family, response regulator AtoC